MDSSFHKSSPTVQVTQDHPTPLLKRVLNDGAVNIYQDYTGHAERIEIALPEGKVIIIKDYETVPVYAHYKKIIVTSDNDEPLGSLEIVPENRQLPNSGLRFFEGTSQIGSGSGDIGTAIANQLLTMSDDPRNVATSYVDPEVITAIKVLLKGKSK